MREIGVVIVTYNRIKKLQKALYYYENQLYKPKYILVIDNHSDDETYSYLKEWVQMNGEIQRYVIRLASNIGGSGGFYEGLKQARKLNAEWIWVADDDAYPYRDCFKVLKEYIEQNDMVEISAICASVYSENKIDTWHRRRIKQKCGIITEEKVSAQSYKKIAFELDLFSYVGTCINKEYLIKAGLPIKDFFISYDDSEHSIRLRKLGKIICLPKMRVNHDAVINREMSITWKKYYNIRNKIFSYKLHFGKKQEFILIIYYLMKNSINTLTREICREAINDAINGKLGINEIYKPGWNERKL